jgi:hypothetical protein
MQLADAFFQHRPDPHDYSVRACNTVQLWDVAADKPIGAPFTSHDGAVAITDRRT